ncbi:hypothetical protein F4779DRAFT_582481 [Xylariaceae sp. FL0662B]|nr:hypothetical protein F4779DRAFT_582481 [Xylariaceae sp. FL0662B]
MYTDLVLVLVFASSLVSAVAAPEPAKVVRGVNPRQTSDPNTSGIQSIQTDTAVLTIQTDTSSIRSIEADTSSGGPIQTDTSSVGPIQTDTSSVLSIETNTVLSSVTSGPESTGTVTSAPSESTGAITSTPSESTATPSSSVSEDGAPRETGFVVAAAAAAGLLGAVVAL